MYLTQSDSAKGEFQETTKERKKKEMREKERDKKEGKETKNEDVECREEKGEGRKL